MATLLLRSETLRDRISRYRVLKGQAKAVYELQVRGKTIAQLLSKLDTLSASIRLFRQYEVEVGKCPRPSASLLGKPQSLATAFGNDPMSLSNEESRFGDTFGKPLEDLCSKVESHLLECWRRTVDGKLPTINSQLLQTFRVLGFANEVGEIEALSAQAKALRDRLPLDKSAFESLESIRKKLALIWLRLEKIPMNVRKFLELAANRGAKYDDLTDEVRDWLIQNGLMGMLRISVAK